MTASIWGSTWTGTVGVIAVVGAALAGCSESGAASSFRTRACSLADEKPSTTAQRTDLGRRALAIAEPMNGQRASRETSRILQLVVQLPTLAALPEGGTLPAPPVPPDPRTRFATSLEDALSAIKEECERS